MEEEQSAKVDISAKVEPLNNETPAGGTHPPGGVAILVRHGSRYSLVKKRSYRKTELVAIKVGVALFGDIYSPPSSEWEGMEEALEAFRDMAPGNALLRGDF